MSPTNGEICFKCGRLLPRSKQAYVVGGKIVCAECDKLLRSEQVPQPAPSPKPISQSPLSADAISTGEAPFVYKPPSATVKSTVPVGSLQPELIRICEWCAESIPQKALRCPRCHNWRRDIVNDRRRVVVGILIEAGFMILGCIFFMEVDRGRDINIWHEKVSPPQDTRVRGPIGDSINALINVTTNYRYQFSVAKFLGSWQGWFVIACGVGFIYGVYETRLGFINLKQKTGSLWV